MLASGSEVALCLETAKKLKEKNIKCNVVSMPCFELFDKQDSKYKAKILQGKVVGVEALSSNELYKFCDELYNMQSFGESGKDKDVLAYFGFTVDKLCEFLLRL